MFNLKSLGVALAALALLVPSVSLAQSSTGLLTVYVQVLNQYGTSYAPSNFTVNVSGQNPSPASFQGSQQGTLVTLNPGAFNVSVANLGGFTANYSNGCSNTLAAGQTHTCVITLSGNNYNYPFTSYVYPSNYYVQPPFTCRTDTPTVGMGQSARFVAQGGVGGTYNWFAEGRNYPNAGPVLTIPFDSTGGHSVTVTNGAQTASCMINVVSGYYPTYPQSSYTYPTYGYPTVTAQAYTYPRFPNTGFEPLSSAQWAFALVLLMGASMAAYPYARKAFALAVR